jgi:uncharacterized protein with FMN-binding domain
MKRKVVIALVAVLLVAGAALRVSAAGNEAKEKAALAAAQSWLKLIDDGNYGGSWDEAASFFKNSISREQWSQQLTAVRTPLGKKVTRTFKNATYATSLPGAPDGEYVVIQFDASFENKKVAVETVTPMLDKDGKWRVSGYYIK